MALAGPAGGGVIDFSSVGGDEAHLMSGSRLGARVTGFGAGDAVDFQAVKYASTDTPTYSGGVVAIDDQAGATVARFEVTGTYTPANFHLSNDGSGHLLVSYAAAPAPAAIDDALAFDAWTALGSSAGTSSGGFDFQGDENAGSGRNLWSVYVGSDGPIGHGPGPARKAGRLGFRG